MSRDSGEPLPKRRSSCIRFQKIGKITSVLATPLLLTAAIAAGLASGPSKGITKAAAESCRAKVEKLEAFEAKANPAGKHTTRFSQEEINSYFALDLSASYNPCLKSLRFEFEEGRLRGDAVIDFDRLGPGSSKLLGRIMASMFSGAHELSARGKLIARTGTAHFQPEDAKFDGTSLPNFLVEEIITAAGKRQRPPFDPMHPSRMPYRIDEVELHPGYIVVYQ
jgi:hypothetical protein